jgi:hypothetical protein
MQQRTTRVNASEETVKIGPLGIRFLLTGNDSNGSVSMFEIPQGLQAPRVPRQACSLHNTMRV